MSVVLARGKSRVIDGTVLPRDGLVTASSPRDRDGSPPRTAPSQPPPTRPVPPPTAPPLNRQKTPRHVSDVATAALHSAAFQKLHEGTSGTFTTFRVAAGGQLKEIVKREKLDGHRSSDISYHADRLGHGLNSPTLLGRSPPRTPLLSAERQPADPLLTSLGSPSAGGRPPSRMPSSSATAVPSNRAEAVATADRLRRGLDDLAADADIAEDIPLWDAALADVVAQVQVHCLERGQLLESIRQHHKLVFNKLLEQRDAEMAGLSAQAKAELVRSRMASQKAAQTALMFQRAVLKTEIESHQAAHHEEQSELLKERLTHSMDLNTARAQQKVLKQQLDESRRRVAARSRVAMRRGHAATVGHRGRRRRHPKAWGLGPGAAPPSPPLTPPPPPS